MKTDIAVGVSTCVPARIRNKLSWSVRVTRLATSPRAFTADRLSHRSAFTHSDHVPFPCRSEVAPVPLAPHSHAANVQHAQGGAPGEAGCGRDNQVTRKLLRSCPPRVPQSCPPRSRRASQLPCRRVAQRLPKSQPRVGPNSTEAIRVVHPFAEIGPSWPMPAKVWSSRAKTHTETLTNIHRIWPPKVCRQMFVKFGRHRPSFRQIRPKSVRLGQIWPTGPRLPEQLFDNCSATVRQHLDSPGARRDRPGQLCGRRAERGEQLFGNSRIA